MALTPKLRWTLVAAAILAVVAVGVAVLAYLSIDPQSFANAAAARVEAATGRKLEFRGPIKLALFPRLAVVAQDVHLANAEWGSRPDFVSVKKIGAELAIWPLIVARSMQFERFQIDGPDVLLETNEKGVGNWRFGADAAGGKAAPRDPQAMAGSPVVLAGALVIDDGRVTWQATDGEPLVVEIPHLRMRPAPEGGLVVDAELVAAEQKWSVDATSSDLVAWVGKTAPLALGLAAKSSGARLNAKGMLEHVSDDVRSTVAVAFEWDKGSDLMERVRPGLAGAPGKISADVTSDRERTSIANLHATLGEDDIAGQLAFIGTNPTRIEGKLHATSIDVPRWSMQPKAEPAKARKPAATGKGNARKAAAAGDPFESAAFAVDLSADRIRIRPGIDATAFATRLSSTKDKFEARPLAFSLAGGRVEGSLELDQRRGSAHIALQGRKIEVSKLVAALGYAKNLSGGSAEVAIDLAGPSKTAAAFVDGADGTVRVDMGPMHVAGIALDAGALGLGQILDAVNPMRRVDQSTQVECFVARLSVKDGVAFSDRTLALETSRIAVAASGTIDLAKETVDLTIRPHARTQLPVDIRLADVVRVRGPIAKPQIGLDSLNAARAALAIGGAVPTGGLSLLLGGLLTTPEDPNPCKTARAGGKISAGAGRDGSSANGNAPDLLAPLRGLFR